MITPLTNPPIPLNGDLERGMFVRVEALGSDDDPLRTTTHQQELLSFCSNINKKINVLYMQPQTYLGRLNYEKCATTFADFLKGAQYSGIQTRIWVGGSAWGQATTLPWINDHIIQPLQKFQTELHSFDSVLLDVKYWNDRNDTSDTGNVPGLCTLMKTIRKILQVRVGCFVKPDLITHAPFVFQSVSRSAGGHLMDNADYVVVESYSNTADGQQAFIDPWLIEASNPDNGASTVVVGATTQNVSPLNTTYWSLGTTYMEKQFAMISANCATSRDFVGFAISDYQSYSNMLP